MRRAVPRGAGAWRAACALAALMLTLPVARGADARQTGTDVAETDLVAASNGRMVTLGALTGRAAAAAVPLELYVARVLAGEAEPAAPAAAMQALAVGIRTYAIVTAGRHRARGFDLCDTTHCQVPRAATPATRAAAVATAGLVLAHEGRPVEVFYSASCGGRTAHVSDVWPLARMPYLTSVSDDVHDDDVPWTLELTLGEIERAVSRADVRRGRLRALRIEARNATDRVARVRLEGLDPAVMTGEQLRAALGYRELRSTAFSIETRGNRVRFTGVGYGHGVGLCVIGAGRRARRGEDAAAILSQYYPLLEVASLGPP